MKHTFIYNKAKRTKNESGITRSRTHLFNIIKPYSVVKRMAVIIMTAIMIICQTGCGTSGSNGAIVPGSSITPAKKKGNVTDIAKNSDNATLVGIVSSIDTTLKNIHFIDVETGTEYSVMYTGGTDIQDAYGKLKAATLIQPGEIYDVYCNKYGKATKIYGSKNAWSRTSVTDIELDESSKSVVIGQTTLNYRDYTVVTSGGNLISIAQIVKEDELTLRGIDDKLYSISVDNGHGYLELTGIDAFVGGYVTLGSSLLYGVTQDMMLTVGVGTYDVELQSADMTATKKVTIKKDATSTLDFSEYKQLSAKKGAINFSVTPENAIMAIDGSEVDYSKPVSLTYGSHTLTLQANHYETYTETFTVNSDYKTKVIDMTSTSSSTTAKTTSASLTNGYSVNITAPSGAALYVDSVYIGVVPCSFSKSSGNKTITLSQSGYNTVSYTISIPNTAGDMTYAFPDMTKTSETATVQTPTVTTPTATSSN